MDFAPEPVLDAFTPPPARSAPRTPAPDDNGQTFGDHLEAVNEPEPERAPPPTRAETKDEVPPTETKAAQTDDTEPSDEPADPDVALLGGPLPPTPPPMAAPVVVQIAASQPPVQQAEPQDAPDAGVAPIEAPPPVAPTQEADAAPTDSSEDAKPAAPGEVRHAAAKSEPAPQTTPQTAQPEAAPVQPVAQQTAQQPTAPATEAPAVLQQIVAAAATQTPAQTPAQRTQRASQETQPSEDKVSTDKGEARVETTANTDKAQAPKANAANAAVVDAPAPQPQHTNAPLDPAQGAQASAINATASQASTHVQHAAVDEGAQRAAPAGAQVGREIIRRFDGRNTSFDIRLDPAELGRVDVRMEVSRDHRVTAVITADNPQALTELARHARDLEQQLQSAGLQLGENGLSFDLRQGAQGGENADNNNSNARSGGGEQAQAEQQQPTPTARPIGYERWRGVRVDMMV